MRKIAGVTDALSKVRVGKDAVSRIASRLKGQQKEWRERSLEEKAYPYLYLDATYLKVRWGASVTSMALLVCVGVDEEGFSGGSGGGGGWLGEGGQPTPRCFEGSSIGACAEWVSGDLG